jgi:hypothetical protein
MRKPGLFLLFAGGAWFLHAGCSSDDGASPPPLAPDASAGTAGAASGSSGAAGSGGSSGASSGGTGGGAGASGAASGGSSSGGSSSGGTSGTSSGGTSGTSSGGTSGVAGSSGAGAQGGTDAGSGGTAGTPTDPCQGARLCETFESYAVGSPPGGAWEPRTSRGAVSVVDTQKFGGARSVRFTTEANSAGKTAFIRNDSTAVFPVPGNAYYGRMMFRLESAPETAVHWTFLQSTGTIMGQTYRATYRYGGQHPVTQSGSFVGNQLMANYDTPDSYSGNGPRSDCWHHANRKVVPVGRWACAEWQFDGPNNTLRFWLDGQALDDLTVTGRGQGCVSQPATYQWTAPNFADLEIGWESYQNDVVRTLYIDDVVIHTRRVGCPAAP